MIELTIVIAIMLVMLGLGIQWYLSIAQRQEVDNLIATESRELAELKGAVAAYLKDAANVSGWAADSRTAIGVQTLVDKGLLPTAFATRRGHLGESPFGQSYAIAGIKDGPAGDANVPDGRLRALIYESSAAEPLASRLDRTGTANTDSGKQGLKSLIAQIASTAGTTAGVVPKGSSTATGNLTSWTKDLSRWTQAAATTPQVVVPVGFTDIDPSLCIGAGCGGTTDANVVYENCSVQTAQCGYGGNFDDATGACTVPGDPTRNYSVVSPTCGSGMTEVGRITHCGVVTSGTKVGAMTVGRSLKPIIFSKDDQDPRKCNEGLNDACKNDLLTYQNKYYDGVVTLNAVEYARYSCTFDGYATGYNPYNPSAITHIGAGWPGFGGTSSSGYDVLCCQTRTP